MIPKEDIEYLANSIKWERDEIYKCEREGKEVSLLHPMSKAESILKGLMGRNWRKKDESE